MGSIFSVENEDNKVHAKLQGAYCCSVFNVVRELLVCTSTALVVCGQDQFDDLIQTDAVFDLSKDSGTGSTHLGGIPRHHV